MSRARTALACLSAPWVAACGRPASPAAAAAASPSIPAQPPPTVRLRPAAQAILGDQAVGAARRGGHDHLTAEEAAREQPDQAAPLAEYAGWGWPGGARRAWSPADEAPVITAPP